MLDLLATGYPSIDHIVPVSRIPTTGQTALLGESLDPTRATFGGCGANVAVALQRLGYQTGLAMVLGADAAGHRYRDYLVKQGIDCRNLIQLRDCASSASYLFRAPDGEAINFFYPGAADSWHDRLSLQGLDKFRWGLVTVGYAPYNRAFVEQLVAAHIPIIWQMKADIAAYPREILAQFVSASRILFCNRLEADYLIKGLGLPSLRDVFAHGVEQVILTLGSEGSQVLTPQGAFYIPIVPANMVDTTGAGDAYTAGFLTGLWHGYEPLICGRLGATAAAFAVEVVGCQTNLPDWSQLQSRYQENFGAL